MTQDRENILVAIRTMIFGEYKNEIELNSILEYLEQETGDDNIVVFLTEKKYEKLAAEEIMMLAIKRGLERQPR